MNRARHTFSISSVYKVNSLQHSVFATTLAGWYIGFTVRGPRGTSIRTPHISSVTFPL